MNTLTVWGAVLLVSLSTVLTRAGLLLVGKRWTLPPWVEEAVRYAPPAALAGIVVPDVLWNEGAFDASFSNPRLVAGIAAAIVCATTRNIIATIVAGMAAFTLLRLYA